MIRILFFAALLAPSIQLSNVMAYKQDVSITDQYKRVNSRLLQQNRTLAPVIRPVIKPVTKPAQIPVKPSKPVAAPSVITSLSVNNVKPANSPTKPFQPKATPATNKSVQTAAIQPLQPVPKPAEARFVSPTKPLQNPAQPLMPSKPFQPMPRPTEPLIKPMKPAVAPVTATPVIPLPFAGGINTQVNWFCGNRTANTCSSQTCTDPISGCSENKKNNRDCLSECIPVPSPKPSTKPIIHLPFAGGINTQVNWFCGNRTANTCSSQMCTDPISGCSENRKNNRDCLNECIPVPSSKPSTKPNIPVAM